MPDYFSHAICAQKILEKCCKQTKNAVCDHTLYYLGAQGGDVFFAYKLNFSTANLGRRMHRLQAKDIFEILKDENKSYAAGFATHYALDCTLHPAIYEFEENSRSPLAHLKFEKDLGLYISRKYAIPRNILPREHVLGATFEVYDCIKRIQPEVTVTGIERCLKRHFAYTRSLIKNKKQTYSCDYDYRRLSTSVEEAVSLGVSCVESVVSGKIDEELFSRSFLERQSAALSSSSQKTLS